MKSKTTAGIVIAILLLVAATTYINAAEKSRGFDKTLPGKIIQNTEHQNWISDQNNKGISILPEGFTYLERSEIYTTSRMRVLSPQEPETQEQYNADLLENEGVEGIIFSPDGKQFIDIRNIPRKGYNATDVRYYGIRGDKIVDARFAECYYKFNCYYDYAYFVDNNTFVVYEISQYTGGKGEKPKECLDSGECEYTFKIHLVNLDTNSRVIYESPAFWGILNLLVPEIESLQ
jgi:hypothetical protein